MAKIAQGTIHKFTTGEFVDADTAPQGGALNPIFEIIRLALNDTDGRVDNVYTKTESDNKYIANASGLQSAFTNTAPSPVTLNYGQQVLTMAETAPLQNLKLQGRTLVNTMGRRGNCESLLDWGASGNHTATLDTTTFTQGSASYKLVATGAGSGSNGLSSTTGILNIKDDTDYLLIMNLKALSGTPTVHSELWGTIGTKLANVVDTNWKTYVFKVKSSSAGQLKQLFIWLTAAGTVYVDAIRLYEVTGSMLTETDTMTSDQIAAKYPYVDDMKSIANPYAIKYGENLVPPINEWTTLSNQATVVEPYKLSVVANGTTLVHQTDKIKVLPNQTYTLSGTMSSLNADIYYDVVGYDANGNSVLDSINQLGTGSLTFSTPSTIDTVQFRIVIGSPVTSGTFTFTNPTLNIGSTAITFKPRNDDYLFFPNVQLSSSLDGTVYDTLSQRDGKYFKLSRHKTMDLDGSLTYSLGNDLTGYKIVAANNISNLVTSFNNLVKYDGKILKQAVDTSDGSWSDAANKIVYVGIPDIDSGWGETYVPSAAEIQAYFNGWKMYDNGADFTAKYSTGTKAWCYRADGSRGVSSGDYTGGTNTLPTTIAPNFKPYKVQYQLAISLVEEVQVEGSITLHEGLNQIEVGNGVQVRERANPNYYSVNNEYLINNTAFAPSQLAYRTQKILSVYRNEKIDQRFTNPAGSAYGNVQARIGATDYDPSASYTVTYLTLDTYKITGNLLQITAEYPTNIKTTIDQLAINQADMTTRIGVLENVKAGKAQPQWIAPTLLNSWVNNGGVNDPVGYMKDELGFVVLRGMIKSGGAGLAIFYLPPKYRPAYTLEYVISSYNGTSLVAGGAEIRSDGMVMVWSVGGTWTSLDGVRFLAEQ